MARDTSNLRGKTFDNLRVIRRVENSPSGQVRWLCRCACGNTCVVEARHLRSGVTKSCGCLPKKVQSAAMSEKQMSTQPSVSLTRLRNQGGDPYQTLASAIVAVAADDYRTALRDGDSMVQRSVENFFRSDWCRSLTDVDTDRLMGMLRAETGGALQTAYI